MAIFIRLDGKERQKERQADVDNSNCVDWLRTATTTIASGSADGGGGLPGGRGVSEDLEIILFNIIF